VSQDGPAPDPADLGFLLCWLHQLDPPPVPLPAFQPLVSVRRAIDESVAIEEEERGWLRTRCEQLQAVYCRLGFQLPTGMIHGDAWRGNLLRDGKRVVLADWDTVSIGHREIDLIPTLQAPRFGLREQERDAFVAAYGRDIRSWAAVLFRLSGRCGRRARQRDSPYACRGGCNIAAQASLRP
jgi:aminoglycoside phosphotransferase (APT) family kinase protein